MIDMIITEKAKTKIKEAISNIDYNHQAMGCGLEDRNITDRYEAMEHGFDEALKMVFEAIENIE